MRSSHAPGCIHRGDVFFHECVPAKLTPGLPTAPTRETPHVEVKCATFAPETIPADVRAKMDRDRHGGELLDLAWGVIANAYGGDWATAPAEWRNAAERWRTDYMGGERYVPRLSALEHELHDRAQLAECEAANARVELKAAGAAAADLRQDAERYKADWLRACETIAQMHAAAMGEVCGPNRGVVEDVADLRAELERERRELSRLRDEVCELKEQRDIARVAAAAVVAKGPVRS